MLYFQLTSINIQLAVAPQNPQTIDQDSWVEGGVEKGKPVNILTRQGRLNRFRCLYLKVSQARVSAEMMRFNFRYFCMFVLIFMVELIIAIFIKDSFIRPFIGDVFVIMLIYSFIRTFFLGEKVKVVIAVLVFSYLIEIGQYYDLVSILHLQDITVARIVIGSTFDVIDLLAYSVGAFLLMLPTMLFSNNTIDSMENVDRVN